MFGQDKHSTPVLTSFISYTFRTVNTRARAYVVPDTPESKGVYCSVAAIASRTSCARMNFHLIRSITVGVFLYYFRVHFGFLCFCLLFFFCMLLFVIRGVFVYTLINVYFICRAVNVFVLQDRANIKYHLFQPSFVLSFGLHTAYTAHI